MAQDAECKARIYSPKDVVFLRCDGCIGFSPRGGVSRSDNPSQLMATVVMDIGYLGKEEFHPDRKQETTERISGMAARAAPFLPGFAEGMKLYLGSVGHISYILGLMEGLNDPERLERVRSETFLGIADFKEVAKEVVAAAKALPDYEYAALDEKARSYAGHVMAAEMQWLGFSPDEQSAFIVSEEGSKLLTDKLAPQLQKMVEDEKYVGRLFDKVSGSISRALAEQASLTTPGGFTLISSAFSPEPQLALPPSAAWDFPETKRARELVGGVLSKLDPAIQPLLNFPLQQADHTILVDDKSNNVSAMLPQIMSTPRQGTYVSFSNTSFVATQPVVRGVETYHYTHGRNPPHFFRNIQLSRDFQENNYQPEFAHRLVEEEAHAALFGIFKNKALPYEPGDRSAAAGLEILRKEITTRPDLCREMNYDPAFSGPKAHIELAGAAIAKWGAEGREKLEELWQPMANFMDRFVLAKAQQKMQQVDGLPNL